MTKELVNELRVEAKRFEENEYQAIAEMLRLAATRLELLDQAAKEAYKWLDGDGYNDKVLATLREAMEAGDDNS